MRPTLKWETQLNGAPTHKEVEKPLDVAPPLNRKKTAKLRPHLKRFRLKREKNTAKWRPHIWRRQKLLFAPPLKRTQSAKWRPTYIEEKITRLCAPPPSLKREEKTPLVLHLQRNRKLNVAFPSKKRRKHCKISPPPARREKIEIAQFLVFN